MYPATSSARRVPPAAMPSVVLPLLQVALCTTTSGAMPLPAPPAPPLPLPRGLPPLTMASTCRAVSRYAISCSLPSHPWTRNT